MYVKNTAFILDTSPCCCFLNSIRDNRFGSCPVQVFQASLKLLRMMLKEFVSSHQLGRPETSYCLEHVWPSLLSRTGESTVRLRMLAIDFIQVNIIQVT